MHMPITDCIDVRCPFCRNYLTDLDGIWECQNGCGAYETITFGGETVWELPEAPFLNNYWSACEYELYNSEGKLIDGYRLKDMGIFS